MHCTTQKTCRGGGAQWGSMDTNPGSRNRLSSSPWKMSCDTPPSWMNS